MGTSGKGCHWKPNEATCTEGTQGNPGPCGLSEEPQRSSPSEEGLVQREWSLWSVYKGTVSVLLGLRTQHISSPHTLHWAGHPPHLGLISSRCTCCNHLLIGHSHFFYHPFAAQQPECLVQKLTHVLSIVLAANSSMTF